jgi:hypothetical protein
MYAPIFSYLDNNKTTTVWWYGTLRTKMVKPEHNPLGCEAALGQDLVDLVGGEIRVGVVVHPLGQRLTLSGLGNSPVLRIRMQIRIPLVNLTRIRIQILASKKGSNP